MIYDKAEKVLALALGLIIGAACMSMVVSVAHRVADKPEPAIAASMWRTDDPPAGDAIVGIWTDGYIRSRVVVMAYGAAYPFEPGVNALQAIEYNRPTMWTPIP